MKKRTIGILATSVAVGALCLVTDVSSAVAGGKGGGGGFNGGGGGFKGVGGGFKGGGGGFSFHPSFHPGGNFGHAPSFHGPVHISCISRNSI